MYSSVSDAIWWQRLAKRTAGHATVSNFLWEVSTPRVFFCVVKSSQACVPLRGTFNYRTSSSVLLVKCQTNTRVILKVEALGRLLCFRPPRVPRENPSDPPFRRQGHIKVKSLGCPKKINDKGFTPASLMSVCTLSFHLCNTMCQGMFVIVKLNIKWSTGTCVTAHNALLLKHKHCKSKCVVRIHVAVPVLPKSPPSSVCQKLRINLTQESNLRPVQRLLSTDVARFHCKTSCHKQHAAWL